MAKKDNTENWIVNEGKSKKVFDPETGKEAGEEVVVPWTAHYVHGGAQLAANSEEILKSQIAQHPFTLGQAGPAANVVVDRNDDGA